MASKKGASGNILRISMSHRFLPSTSRLSIEIRPRGNGAVAKVSQSGHFLGDKTVEAETSLSRKALDSAWANIVELGGMTLGDYRPHVNDGIVTSIELKWDGGEHEFGGYELQSEEPYKAIVEAIEGLAKKALKEVYSVSDASE